MKFKITVERDVDGRYVAECPDLPGCLSEGETLAEALENINEAIIGCLKSRLKAAGEKLKIADRTFGLIQLDHEVIDEIIEDTEYGSG